jgi:hypothetical protein
MRFAPSLKVPLETPLPRCPGAGGEAGLLWPAGASCLRSLWRLQRNEPGWFVGEHMQETRLLALADGDETLTDLPAERPPLPAASLTRVGEAQRKFGIDRTGPLGRLAAAVAMRARRARASEQAVGCGMEVLVSLLVVA